MESYENRTLTAFFDDRASAETARQRLQELGVTDASIRLTGGDEYVGRDYRDNKGFWESVADFFFPDEDSGAYAEGLRRGGYLLTVTSVRSDVYDRAVDILDDAGSVDLDERASSWRAEGWSTESGVSRTSGLSGTEAGVLGGAAAGLGGSAGYPSGREETGSSISGGLTGREDEAIPVVEERLRVGKRDVNLGRVRVRSYVVEEPVSEDVRLREDRVEVERRPVDRALEGNEAAFVDRTIEAEERAEEAVVSKDARVTEEISLRRESRERTETVSDTVRRTEVEVEDDREPASPDEVTRRGA
jgi:uncharacterized protein (TIGR02271 family)